MAFSRQVLYGPKKPGSQSRTNFVLHLVIRLSCDKVAVASA